MDKGSRVANNRNSQDVPRDRLMKERMTSESANCPFCNARLPALAAVPIVDKLPCPRCGELIPAARWQFDPASAAPPTSEKPAALPGNRKTMLIILGIMATMAIAGLSYALWTVKERRTRDPWMPIAQRRPLELSGIGYLPKGCQFVAGLHVAEMMDDIKTGRKLLAEPRPALLDWVLRQIQRTTGMSLEEIDHVLLAVMPDGQLSQLVMVVQTRKPYALGKIAQAGKPAHPSLHQDRPLYEANLNPAGTALLWCVADRTFIGVIRLDTPQLKDLTGLSAQPRPIDEALSAPIHKAIKERLAKPQLLWAVGELDQLGAARDWLPFALGAKADLGTLKDLKTVVLGVEPGTDLTFTGSFQMTDTKSAARFQTILESAKIDGAKSQKVTVTPAAVKDQWVTWQVRGDAPTMRELLNRGKQAKK